MNTALLSFLQCPGPALPCHQPRAWSIPIKDSGRRRHCPHPVPLNGLGLEVFFSLPQEGAVLLSPHCPQGFSPLVAISRLFTAQQFFGVQRKVQFTVSEAMWIPCKDKCLPQAASRINRLEKQKLGGKRRHNFRVTDLLQDVLLPSRWEVLSQSKHCTKSLPTTTPPSHCPHPHHCQSAGASLLETQTWTNGGRKEGLQAYASGGLEKKLQIKWVYKQY